MSSKFLSRLDEKSIQVYSCHDYQVFRIQEDLGLSADFSKLTSLISGSLKKGQKKIALAFTADSYLFTPTLARLVQFYQMIQEYSGTLCLIQPNESIMNVLDKIGLKNNIKIVNSETELTAS
jgi:anti-anti-sigma regulatory factor